MYEEIMKEFKTFREQVYAKFSEYDEILRTLISSNSEKIVSTFTDENAVKVIDLYPVWTVGISVAKDSRYQYNGKLYKCVQAHTTQADWTPDVAVSLFEVIDVEHSGTAEDPIPWAVNMQCYNGKYYTFDNVLYLCIRDSGIALAYTPDQLIGNYFELA